MTHHAQNIPPVGSRVSYMSPETQSIAQGTVQKVLEHPEATPGTARSARRLVVRDDSNNKEHVIDPAAIHTVHQ